MEELQEIAAIIEGLGEKGMIAFIVWVLIDLAKVVAVYGFLAWALIGAASRVKTGLLAFKKAGEV